MTQEPNPTPQAIEAIGKLCMGGDRACANGDFSSVRVVAILLADYVPEPVHCRLQALVEACTAAPDRVSALWDELKNQVYSQVRE